MAGRRESALDPSTGPVAQFAFELRKLRAEAGSPTYRAMAQRTAQGASTLSQAAAGERLPTLPVALAYVRACGGDETEWEARWREAAAEAAAEPRTEGEDIRPPYRGLTRFEPADVDLFFGRGELTERLFQQASSRRFTAVFGPSGSGKSSLLRAGLIPRLRNTGPTSPRPATVRVLTPGEHPLRTHTQRLMPADGEGDTWLIVDQFEELYALCADPAERDQFIDRLLAATDPSSRLRVVIAVRADFLGRCAEHPRLTTALQDGTVLAGPMSRDELREAIVKPAQAAGLIVERQLTTRILDEVEEEPGALPLMSHALLETWRRRKGRALTAEAYDAAGGLSGAIAHTAEAVHTDLTPSQADLARRILLRLITPGEGTPDTRRPAPRFELDFGDPIDTATVLEHLARARLLILEHDTVDLAHEALITGWPRLRNWIEQDRELIRLHHALTDAARTWTDLNRDAGVLYRGSRLTAVEEHLTPDHLTSTERSFLAASVAAREQERRTATRASRRLRRLRTALSLAAALILITATLAWQQSRSRDHEQALAEARRTAALADALRATDPATAMELSLASWRLAHLPETRSALIGAMTQREQDAFADPDPNPTAERYLGADGRTLLSADTRQAVLWDVRTHRRIAAYPGLGEELTQAGALSSDNRRLTLLGGDLPRGSEQARSADQMRVWDIRAGRVEGPAFSAAEGAEFGPSGRTALLYGTAGGRQVVRLVDVASRRVLLRLRLDTASHVAGGVPIPLSDWNAHRVLRQRNLADYPFPDAVVSADDKLVALCRPGKPVELWTVTGRRRLSAAWAPIATADDCLEENVRLTPDGRRLVLLTTSGVRIWDIASGQRLPGISHKGLREVEFSGDGTYMVASDADEILLWRVGTGAPTAATLVLRYPLPDESASELRIDLQAQRISYLGGRTENVVRSLTLHGVLTVNWQNTPVTAAAFSPDGRTLATARLDRAFGRTRFQVRNGDRVTDLPLVACPTPPGEPRAPAPCTVLLAFRPDSRVLAYGVSNPSQSVPSEHVALWDIATRRVITILPTARADSEHPGLLGNAVNGIAFGPHGTLLTSRPPVEEEIESWELSRKTMVRRTAGLGGEILAVRPDDRLLVTSHGQLLDLRTGRVTRQTLTSGTVTALTFSPDGRYLAAGDESGQVTVWDRDVRRRRVVLPAIPAHTDDGTSGAVSALAFSPDDRTLATAKDDRTLHLWDNASNQSLGSSLPTSGDTVLALTFGQDGHTLHAAGEHIPLQLYGISPREVAAKICARLDEVPPTDWQTQVTSVPHQPLCPG
jgi:WD40 repeat protein